LHRLALADGLARDDHASVRIVIPDTRDNGFRCYLVCVLKLKKIVGTSKEKK
jgi:hypothetical protein